MMAVIAIPMPVVVPRTAVRRGAECEDIHHDERENDCDGSNSCGDSKSAALGERAVNVADDENHTGYEQDACENQ